MVDNRTRVGIFDRKKDEIHAGFAIGYRLGRDRADHGSACVFLLVPYLRLVGEMDIFLVVVIHFTLTVIRGNFFFAIIASRRRGNLIKHSVSVEQRNGVFFKYLE